MGKIVKGHVPCLDQVKCKSSDAMSIYEDGTATCFSCKRAFSKSEVDAGHVKNQDESDSFSVVNTKKVYGVGVNLSIEEIQSYATRGIKDRGIEKAVCEKFGVRVSFNEDGEIDAHYYPYGEGIIVKGYKVRTLPKKFQWVGDAHGLFGKMSFNGGGKRLVICEGEIDALSVAQAYMTRYEQIYPVVAISSATMTEALLTYRDWLRTFNEVVLFLDNDERGQEATAAAVKIIGIDKARLCKFDLKDANDVLLQQGAQRVLQIIWDAQPWSPVGIMRRDALWEALVKYDEMQSMPYPPCLQGVNSKTKGKRQGEIVLFISGTGCLGIGTPILMYDGSLKNVEDINVGDVVMGDDNLPRNVLSLNRGKEMMFEVSIRGKDKFICNASHVLSVVNNDNEGRWGLQQNQVVDVKLSDYLDWSTKRKHLSKAFKVGRVEFKNNNILPIDPYVLGVWLGDGYSDAGRISSADPEIPRKLNELGYPTVKHLTKHSWGVSNLSSKLIELDVLKNKHIPEIYLTASVEDRLKLLAGLIDTDGHLAEGNCYEFSQKSISFTEQVVRLVNSLGYQATHSEQKENVFGVCQRVYISGSHLEDIPVVLERKKACARKQIKNPLRFKMDILPLYEDNYYGFEVDGNQRYVLGNFIVTHNSGKSTLLRECILFDLESDPEAKVGVLSLEEAPAETTRKLSGMALNRNPAEEEIPLEELKVGFDKVFGDDRVLVLDHQGAIDDGTVVDQLEYMALCGCKNIYVDHITMLASEGSDDLKGNEAVDKIMNDFLKLVKRQPVWLGVVSHLRKVGQGKRPFEEGTLPSIDDIKGCLAYGTDVLLYNGHIKAVQDVQVGDILMGDDGTPRNVVRLFRGEQQMYRVTMKTTGDTFVCNEDHILTVSYNDTFRDIPLNHFIRCGDNFKERCKQHYSTGYELPESPVLIPAYSLGAWLGDGSKSAFRIMDASSLGIAERVAYELNAILRPPSDIKHEYFNFDTGVVGDMLDRLKALNLFCNKHIPELYELNSKAVRYDLLAGLIDTDGTYSAKDNAYYFYQKNYQMALSVRNIARSLGLYSNIRSQIISGSYSSNGSEIFVVTISGNIESIPAQKSSKLTKKPRVTNALKRGFLIEKLEVQPYYGFGLDGNGRFLLGNHIITHNSGSIKQVSFDIIAFARNMIADDDTERNTINMRVLKCRYTGLTGNVAGAIYNQKTGRLKYCGDETFDIIPKKQVEQGSVFEPTVKKVEPVAKEVTSVTQKKVPGIIKVPSISSKPPEERF